MPVDKVKKKIILAAHTLRSKHLPNEALNYRNTVPAKWKIALRAHSP